MNVLLEKIFKYMLAQNVPPGKYGRKIETQRNWREPAQAVEHVV